MTSASYLVNPRKKHSQYSHLELLRHRNLTGNQEGVERKLIHEQRWWKRSEGWCITRLTSSGVVSSGLSLSPSWLKRNEWGVTWRWLVTALYIFWNAVVLFTFKNNGSFPSDWTERVTSPQYISSHQLLILSGSGAGVWLFLTDNCNRLWFQLGR
jgi:hypothetical protein